MLFPQKATQSTYAHPCCEHQADSLFLSTGSHCAALADLKLTMQISLALNSQRSTFSTMIQGMHGTSSVVAQAFNANTWEAEADGSL